MGKDGESPGREMREVEGVEEQQGGKGRGRTAELNQCCRAVPFFWPSGPAKGHSGMETATMVMESPNTLAQDTKWSRGADAAREMWGNSRCLLPQLWSPLRAGASLPAGLTGGQRRRTRDGRETRPGGEQAMDGAVPPSRARGAPPGPSKEPSSAMSCWAGKDTASAGGGWKGWGCCSECQGIYRGKSSTSTSPSGLCRAGSQQL